MPPAELSVVLVNNYGLDRLRRILDSLAVQSLADRFEVIVVSPFEAPDPGSSPFASLRYVKCSRIDSLGPARALGVQSCSAPFLVFGEDHCFPQPGWAATLLDRLREGWTGVGPAIPNHNPSTWISRADWLLNYGCFSRLAARGPVTTIPPHNSAYVTAVLQALGTDLPGLLEMDHHLQARLRAEGGRLCFEPAAQAAHTNLSRPFAHWSSQFHGARIYGATRATFQRWTALRRCIYVAAFPMIAALRLIRACSLLNTWRSLPVVPLLVMASMVAATGEATGYLLGLGSSFRYRVSEELDRPSGVTGSDRRLLLP
jgi:hypothetical protein